MVAFLQRSHLVQPVQIGSLLGTCPVHKQTPASQALQVDNLLHRKPLEFALKCQAFEAQAAQARTDVDNNSQVAPSSTLTLSVQVLRSIDEAPQEDWDACATASGEVNPFLLWNFLHALEVSQSAVARTGWIPQHLLVRDSETKEIVACCPMYLKMHSYGEYVFDHSWADAFSRMGQSYYPKMQSCVPFTPAAGQRLLIKRVELTEPIAKAVAKTLITIAEELKVSSLHFTFNTKAEWDSLKDCGYLQRTGIQYHWENCGYSSFDDFLMALRQSKRKSIRQERKKVLNEGFVCERLTGDDIKTSHWDAFYEFYMNTTYRKWGRPYLTREFFRTVGETMADRILLVIATEDAGQGDVVAGALNFIGSHTLYGRNWGSSKGETVKNLHFELCYYQALEAAIEMKLQRVEAGAQGEHKIQRGYLPTLTYSSHYIVDPVFRTAVEAFLQRDRARTDYLMLLQLEEASPYKELLPLPELASFSSSLM